MPRLKSSHTIPFFGLRFFFQAKYIIIAPSVLLKATKNNDPYRRVISRHKT
ncbi:hypothetical protein AN958_11442 [Leucoagaricus sp. SymC.cos]|nr:hypothetical protein AN958_11442 [Leucoagaricus sp. SymC.cos]